VGVALGMNFPAGEALDALATDARGGLDALRASGERTKGATLAPIPTNGLFFNLSGMETQCLRAIEAGARAADLARAIFENITDCLLGIGANAARAHGAKEILFTGGVAAAKSLRTRIAAEPWPAPIFGDAALCGDNAVGIALLGVEKLWP
jgi:tRNA A37 threonylcarbamoyltransferase TsaD